MKAQSAERDASARKVRQASDELSQRVKEAEELRSQRYELELRLEAARQELRLSKKELEQAEQSRKTLQRDLSKLQSTRVLEDVNLMLRLKRVQVVHDGTGGTTKWKFRVTLDGREQLIPTKSYDDDKGPIADAWEAIAYRTREGSLVRARP